jgi:CPA1 family monovalent cation:H+ antiporter
MLAEHLHVSGVIATLAAGLLIGNTRSLGAITERGRDAVESFWEYVAFVVNSLIFLLIGVHAARHGFDGNIGVAAIAVMLVVAGRALSVYSCCALFSLSASRVEMRHQHIIFWAGLRGALALALALGLPESIPEREAIRNVAFAVVAFSVFVQGLTMTPLLRKMRVLPRHGAALADSESPVGFSDGL